MKQQYLVMGMTKKAFSELVLSLAGLESQGLVINLPDKVPSCFRVEPSGRIFPVDFDKAINDVVGQFKEKQNDPA